ncbi:hypothetical protein ACVILJ_001358 [Bradyrhizobium diazoefficiens]
MGRGTATPSCPGRDAARRMGRALAKPIMLPRRRKVMGFASLYPSYNPADTPPHPRGLFRPSSALSLHPHQGKRAQGRPGAGWLPLTAMPRAGCATMHSGKQGNRRHPGLPCADGWNGLCRELPGERCTIAPVALRMADARTRSGRNITARLDAQTPGVRTTRFCRTQAAPVVRATLFAHGSPPCEAFAPVKPASTAARPACRDDRDTPLFLGPE